MNKDQFIKTMTDLKALCDDLDNAHKALKRLDPDFGGLYLSRATQISLDILHIAMEDTSNWISYFIYDLEWGKGWHRGVVKSKCGKDIRLKTFEDLYKIVTDKSL